jgi:hypothetical protein
MTGSVHTRQEFLDEPLGAALRVRGTLRLRICSTSPVSARVAMIG